MAFKQQRTDDRASLAVEILLEFLPRFASDKNVLLVENYTPKLSRFMQEQHISYATWNRHWSPETPSSLWPETGQQYDAAIIRLPKSHASFDMVLHATASSVKEDGMIIVYGMNDEGIKGAQKKLNASFGDSEVIGYKQRCRVLAAHNTPHEEIRENLDDFKMLSEISYNHAPLSEILTIPIVFYPGMFAAGDLDVGTKTLLDAALPHIDDNQRILDYGCGSGVIACIIHRLYPETKIDLLDRDSISLEAVRENFPQHNRLIAADSLAGCTEEEYDLIISNPPIHTEKEEHYRTLHQLITNAPTHLKNDGKLIIVTQSRLDLKEYFDRAHMSAHILTEDVHFTVWLGRPRS